MIDRFGTYLIVYVSPQWHTSNSILFKIENDSLIFKNDFSGGLFGPPIYGAFNVFAHSYPYIYSPYDVSTAGSGGPILIRKYLEETNQIDSVNVITTGPFLPGIVANSQNVFTVEGNPGGGAAVMYYYKYTIDDDTLINKVQQCYKGTGPAVNIEGWFIGENIGLKRNGLELYDLSLNPCTFYKKNINFALPSHWFMIKNSVYKIGSGSLYYLNQIIGDSLTFKQFIIPTLPSMPILIYPINNQQVNPDSTNLIWNSSLPNVLEYSVNLSSDSLFSNFIDTLVTDTILGLKYLEINQNYYWRVRARNVLGWSNYSTVGSFNTIVTGFEDNYSDEIDFSLSQNYPNPFNPSTSIEYRVGNRRYVTLKVYDVLGREVATLVNEEKQPGVYEVEFDASQLSSGIYFYTLEAGEFRDTKKLILLK
jgi:hypothetical protein